MSARALSCQSFLVIQQALDHRAKSLETIHWQAVAFGATDPLYRNLAIEGSKIEKARHELATIYEEQFDRTTS